MSRKRGLVSMFLFSMCCVGLAPQAHADGMRCGSKLVSTGDALYTVRSRCGEPTFTMQRKETRTERVWVDAPCTQTKNGTVCGRMGERKTQVLVDQWTYDFGPHQFIQTLTFEQGILISVVSGSYGTKQP